VSSPRGPGLPRLSGVGDSRATTNRGIIVPIALVQTWPSGGDTGNYDAITEVMGVRDNPPDGGLVHTAGFMADGSFRIFDVWETRDHMERFMQERLMPAVQQIAGPDAEPPETEVYELHAFMKA